VFSRIIFYPLEGCISCNKYFVVSLITQYSSVRFKNLKIGRLGRAERNPTINVWCWVSFLKRQVLQLPEPPVRPEALWATKRQASPRVRSSDACGGLLYERLRQRQRSQRPLRQLWATHWLPNLQLSLTQAYCLITLLFKGE